MHGSASLPRTLGARIRAAADARGVPLKRPLYEAIQARIEQVNAEPKDRAHRRVAKYEHGTEMLGYSLPVPLYTRCVGVARSFYNADGESTGTLSYVFRRCIALHYPDPVPVAPDPNQTPKESPVASVILLLPLPPALCAYMQKQRADMSKQIRGAIDEHCASVAANTKVNKATAPYQGKGRMRPVPVRVPLPMHAALKDAARQRGTTMSCIARVCIALAVQAAVRASAPAISAHKSAPATAPQLQGEPA